MVSVGNFDGVHRGHRDMLHHAGQIARSQGCPLAVVTFEPHPLTIVAPHRAPERLTPPEEKLRLLDDADVDIALVLESNRALLSLTCDDFVAEVLIPHFHPRHMVEGPTFGFGRGRTGNVETLARLGRAHGFDVLVVEPVKFKPRQQEPIRVSSSLIRTMVAAGDVRDAAWCLGRRYALFGDVVSGAGRGRGLGYPTANLGVSDQLLPAEGVYAGRATVLAGQASEGTRITAAVSVGHTPTFDGREVSVEAFLLDFDGDLRGARMCLEFVDFVREQRRFASPAELAAQITRDVEQVRALIRDVSQ